MKTTNGKGKICIKRKKKVCKGSYGTWEIKKKCTVMYVAIVEEEFAEMKPADED